jgi:hypothetical protein
MEFLESGERIVVVADVGIRDLVRRDRRKVGWQTAGREKATPVCFSPAIEFMRSHAGEPEVRSNWLGGSQNSVKFLASLDGGLQSPI